MLAITGVYHRYFSHRCYKTARPWQFLFAWIACTSAQKGPLWWASHHRHHHRFADQTEDIHSPKQKGFWYSHILWILIPKHFLTNKELVKDWMRFPELVWLNRYNILPLLVLALLLWGAGIVLESSVPQAQTSGLQMVIWGLCISTVILFHATASINSVAHLVGTRRYQTPDSSRNNWLLSCITLGEGWHNNHHHYPISCRQGFYWWEIDITYYMLKLLSWLGIIHDLVRLPSAKRESNRVTSASDVNTESGAEEPPS
jgi:stearoyl-CoA desaturase (delta-9 desaturase)